MILRKGELNKWCTPVLHFLISIIGDWQVLVEAVVGRVAGRMVYDGGVSAKGEDIDPGLTTVKKSCTSMRAMLKPCDEISTSARQQWQPPPLQTASWCSLQGTSAPSAPCQPRGPGFAPRAPAGALGESSRSHLGAGIASESGGPQNILRNTVGTSGFNGFSPVRILYLLCPQTPQLLLQPRPQLHLQALPLLAGGLELG